MSRDDRENRDARKENTGTGAAKIAAGLPVAPNDGGADPSESGVAAGSRTSEERQIGRAHV